jgi:hypothetical protein
MKEATAPAEQPGLYPILPDAGNGHAYRLQEMTRIQAELRQEADKRAGLCKKYKRSVNAVDGVDATLVSIGAGLGIGGVGLLTTVVAIPVAIGLEAGSLGCAVLCAFGKVVGRRLTAKYDKHQRIETLARAKLNTISDIVSKALVDGNISDTEYNLVLAEVQKFEDMKREIRAKKAPAENIDELKKTLLAQGRREALDDITKRLNTA